MIRVGQNRIYTLYISGRSLGKFLSLFYLSLLAKDENLAVTREECKNFSTIILLAIFDFTQNFSIVTTFQMVGNCFRKVPLTCKPKTIDKIRKILIYIYRQQVFFKAWHGVF
jgi:hypothetical protein